MSTLKKLIICLSIAAVSALLLIKTDIAIFFIILLVSIPCAIGIILSFVWACLGTIAMIFSNRGKLIKQQVKEIRAVAASPGKPFRADRKLMRSIDKRIDIEHNVGILFKSIAGHMGLSKNSLELYIVHSQFDSFEAGGSRAGQYQQSHRGASEVELMLRRDYNSYNIAAILAHECAHHLLAQLGFGAASLEIIELRTDIAAIYTGFGVIIDKGYRGARSEARELEVRLGYINEKEIKYARFLTATSKLRRKR